MAGHDRDACDLTLGKTATSEAVAKLADQLICTRIWSKVDNYRDLERALTDIPAALADPNLLEEHVRAMFEHHLRRLEFYVYLVASDAPTPASEQLTRNPIYTVASEQLVKYIAAFVRHTRGVMEKEKLVGRSVCSRTGLAQINALDKRLDAVLEPDMA